MNLIEFRRATVLRGERPALSDFDLEIQQGESVAILGPNGSGKSTLIGAIMREFYPIRREGSSVRILGEELWNIEELRTRIGIVRSHFVLPSVGSVSGREFVVSSFFGSVGLWNYQRPTDEMWERSEQMLRRVGALHLADRDVDEISSGETRRIEIARALVHQPGTILLDEPSNHLDPGAQAELRLIVQQLIASGTAVIMVTHQTGDVVPGINRVVMLRDGRLFADLPRREAFEAGQLSALFSHPVELFERDGFVHVF